MKMKMKRFWKLYKELRRLRKEVKILENNLHQANLKYNELFYKRAQKVPYSTTSITKPNVCSVESCFSRPYLETL